jgi:hypothetical protein
MAGLFRRFRKDKGTAAPDDEPAPSETPEPSEDPGDAAPEPVEPASEATPIAPAAPAEPLPAPPVAAPVPMSPSDRPPPPLPQPAEGGDARVVGGPGAFSRCFLCGSRMDGPWCPTCRMVWND